MSRGQNHVQAVFVLKMLSYQERTELRLWGDFVQYNCWVYLQRNSVNSFPFCIVGKGWPLMMYKSWESIRVQTVKGKALKCSWGRHQARQNPMNLAMLSMMQTPALLQAQNPMLLGPQHQLQVSCHKTQTWPSLHCAQASDRFRRYLAQIQACWMSMSHYLYSFF